MFLWFHWFYVIHLQCCWNVLYRYIRFALLKVSKYGQQSLIEISLGKEVIVQVECKGFCPAAWLLS